MESEERKVKKVKEGKRRKVTKGRTESDERKVKAMKEGRKNMKEGRKNVKEVKEGK